jgi:oligopeptide/dipeptide ABC transporter ATP-binding protein
MGLVGESGCGKSSLGRLAVGLVRPTSGAVLLDGEPLSVIGPRARPLQDLRIQMVFQNAAGSLNPLRTVGSQIADGMRRLRQPRFARRKQSIAIMERLGLPSAIIDSYPTQLSGGQRQRIAIARALAAEPQILVLDEPLASLDASAQAQVANLLQDLATSDGLGMLLISHDLAVVKHIADRVLVMYLGLVVEESSSRELWETPLHPYTEALIKSVPNPDGNGVLPPSLPGEVGDPANPPLGCRFHPRCPYVFDRCLSEPPRLTYIGPSRQVSCWLHPAGDMQPRGLSPTIMKPPQGKTARPASDTSPPTPSADTKEAVI